MAKKAYSCGPFLKGINSLLDPALIGDSEVQWSVNALNRGGCYQTRPGLSRLEELPLSDQYPARGLTVFLPLNQDPYIVIGVRRSIYVLKYPFTGSWVRLVGPITNDDDDTLSFETCIKGTQTTGGVLQVIDPYPVLMIQSGTSKPITWDGTSSFVLDPSNNQTPIGKYMKWVGNRLWVMDGNKIRVSNILDPWTFTEEDILAEGGFFTLPDVGTGFGLTPDQKSLLAFTNTTTTAFQAGILDRLSWRTTNDFQKILLPDIGCVAPNTIVNQYGILWWLSEGGLIRLDDALVTYRTAKISYEDMNMSRSKVNISPMMLKRACAGTYENFLMLSVPSGDSNNAHTWIMDQSPSDTLGQSTGAVWSTCMTGIRPIQWATANIKGQHRCFAMSKDYPPSSPSDNLPDEYSIWEAFCGNRQDYPGQKVVKEISCAVETKFMGYSEDYKEFKYAELQISEISGPVQLDVFYASRHSGYKSILSKTIISTTDSLTIPTQVSDDLPLVSYLKQTRNIETSTDDAQTSDQDVGVENPLATRNKDRSFSILVRWIGQMSLARVTAFCDDGKEHARDGGSEASETTSRYINQDGVSAILATAPLNHLPNNGLTSQNVSSVSPRWPEFHYQSLP